MSERCKTPVSHLRLELWALGELSTSELRDIDAHLDACPHCRAVADGIREPFALPALDFENLAPTGLPLPEPAAPTGLPLPEPAAPTGLPLPEPAAPAPAPAPAPVIPLRRMAPAVAALAVAAALILVPRPVEGPLEPPTDGRTRGGELALTVLRERAGGVVERPSAFSPSDRFAVLVTCPLGGGQSPRVFAYQHGEWSRPLEDDGLGCGNRVRVPGAFRFTESLPARICVLWSDDAARVEAGLLDPDDVEGAVCHEVAPE